MKNIKKFLFAHRNKFQQNHCNLKKKFREIKRNLRTGVCYSVPLSLRGVTTRSKSSKMKYPVKFTCGEWFEFGVQGNIRRIRGRQDGITAVRILNRR